MSLIVWTLGWLLHFYRETGVQLHVMSVLFLLARFDTHKNGKVSFFKVWTDESFKT